MNAFLDLQVENIFVLNAIIFIIEKTSSNEDKTTTCWDKLLINLHNSDEKNLNAYLCV